MHISLETSVNFNLFRRKKKIGPAESQRSLQNGSNLFSSEIDKAPPSLTFLKSIFNLKSDHEIWPQIYALLFKRFELLTELCGFKILETVEPEHGYYDGNVE